MARKKKILTHEEEVRKWLIPKLRRLSLQWPARYAALSKSRLERGVYFCPLCSEVKSSQKELQADHIVPVVDIKKTNISIEEYCYSLFAKEENWQWICRTCHDTKTSIENTYRSINKKLNKKS